MTQQPFQLVAYLKDFISVRKGQLPRLCQLELPADAPEQVAPQRPFEFANLGADSLRGEVQPLRGAHDATRLGDTPKVVKLFVVKHVDCYQPSVCNE